MDLVINALGVLLVRDLEGFQREVELFPSDELLWETAPGVTNSAGNLALHVAGNLQHYVGAVLGQTGYVRKRELEFGQRSGTRAEAVRELGQAIDVVRRVLPTVSPEVLRNAYPEAVGGVTPPTGRFLMHLAVHLAFHLGQAGYLRRLLTGENRSAGPVSVQALAIP